MKKIKFVFVETFILLLLAGCNNTNENISKVSASNQVSSQTKTVIKIAIPSGKYSKIFNDEVQKFEDTKENVDVNIDWISTTDNYSSYQAAINQGYGYPDAIFIDHMYIQSLAAAGSIYNVSSFINQSKDKYVDNLINANKYENNYYGFPFSANTVALFYNKDIVGDLPIPTTYENFIEIGKQIYENESKKSPEARKQVFSLSVGGSDSDFGAFLFSSWLAREGGSFLSEDLKTSNFDSEEVISVLTKWKEIANLGFANPTTSNENNFYNKNVAFLEMGCWALPRLLGENSIGNFGVAPLFSCKSDETNNSSLGLYSLCVTNQDNEEKMKIAAELCEFLSTNKEIQLAYAKETNLLPVTKEACNDEFYKAPEWKIFVDSLPNAAPRPGSPIWPKIQSYLKELFNNVLQNKCTPEEGAKYVESKIQLLLDKFYN